MIDQANAEMAAYWNGEGGDKWVSFGDRLEAGLKPFGARAIEAAAVQAEENILEIGCGCGPNTIELASRLSSGGITAVDISVKVLAAAEKGVAAKGLSNVEFSCADAQTCDFGLERYNLAFSRFGVMFFDDPVAAFKNISKTLIPGGRVAFACWAALNNNPWIAEPLQVVARHIALPPPPELGTPGPFSLSDESRIQNILTEAGLSNIAIETFRAPMVLGADVAEAVNFLLQMSPTGAAINRAEPDAETRAAIAADLGELLKSYTTQEGVLMGAEAFIVRADKG